MTQATEQRRLIGGVALLKQGAEPPKQIVEVEHVQGRGPLVSLLELDRSAHAQTYRRGGGRAA
jgi:hypothetical protein